jgi:hypothetical protein
MLAGFVQSSLEAIDAGDPLLGRAVRQRLKRDTLEAIEGASPIALIPVDLDVELTECFFAVAGSERARRALRESFRQSCGRPLLGPVLDGIRGILGRALVGAIAWTPKVWGLIYRDCGEMFVASRERGRLRLELRDLPLVVASSADYLSGAAATFAGLFDVAGVAGEVQLIGPDRSSRSAAFDLRWAGLRRARRP